MDPQFVTLVSLFLMLSAIDCFLLPTGSRLSPKNVGISDKIREYLKSSVGEYCFDEEFEAKCYKGETVEVTYAKYGRMSSGRCIAEDEKYLGCSTDVLSVVEMFCHGLQSCRVPINSNYFQRVNNCPDGLDGYLHVMWTCS